MSDANHFHLISGTIGGLVSGFTLYPIELVKTRMQVHESNPTYCNFRGAFLSVLRNEGVQGLYKGMTASLIATSGSWGAYFYLYELSKNRKSNYLKDREKLGTVDHLTSGIEAGVVLVLAFNPLWVIKTRLALQDDLSNRNNQSRAYKGTIDTIQTIVNEEGVLGLYKGLIPALLLTSNGALQFASYEYLKAMWDSWQIKTDSKDSNRRQQPPWVSVLIGGTSKIFASTLTYPYQVVKSRLQQRGSYDISTKLSVSKYNGFVDCVQRIWKYEGMTGFFRGVLPNAMKVAPSAAITFLVYEECMKLCQQFDNRAR